MTKVAKRRAMRKHMGSIMILFFTLFIVIFVVCTSFRLKKKNEAYAQQIQELEEQVKEEENRAEQIEEYSKYVQTKKFVEETAKDKLGLVYDDEIMFKEEESEE